ncbi:LLM class flavin-dependent oxidoreductase [Campylobacter concisus]|uniref:LLM class flavin-dependent oxidoreductase n=1 Tax=Campylobacter concisus TaxID=199 RepID=UPI0021566A91|nr:LLM class flavin-dependent oxidoreductase [Campylobacter concisus]
MNLSILNLLPIKQGSDAKDAINAAIRLAKFAEDIGINRYWVAEHHNMRNLASSATQLIIAHILEHTKKPSSGLWRRDATKPQPLLHRRAVRHS